MDVGDVISGATSFSHIHFAFATITADWNVDVSPVQAQFDKFKTMTGFKRILSFGGWSFSTDQDSFPIFREVVTTVNRQTFADNCVKFVDDNGLDGIDFDWEYPGAPDIPGIPPGGKDDGKNYLEFLKMVRAGLPDGKSVSIAAPASYWYLKGFPLKTWLLYWTMSFS
jgi:chitinase